MSFPSLSRRQKLGIAYTVLGLVALGVAAVSLYHATIGREKSHRADFEVPRLQLKLEECEMKLEDTEDFHELSLIECEREIEYWKGQCLLRVEGCEGVLQTMQEVNTNIGCEARLTTFKHGFYYERAQRKKAERQLESPEDHGAAQPD